MLKKDSRWCIASSWTMLMLIIAWLKHYPLREESLICSFFFNGFEGLIAHIPHANLCWISKSSYLSGYCCLRFWVSVWIIDLFKCRTQFFLGIKNVVSRILSVRISKSFLLEPSPSFLHGDVLQCYWITLFMFLHHSS